MKHIAFAIVATLAFAAIWFFASPLFIDDVVDESFDFVHADGRIDMQRVTAMGENERNEMMDDIMAAASEAPDQAVSDTMPERGPQLLAQGRFADADAIHKGSGNAFIYKLPDGQHLIRFEDFRTTNGPALVVYLANHAAPASASDVTDNGFVRIGELKGNVGNQNYFTEPNVSIAEYKSVVIWCELFGVLFSAAPLG